MIFSFGYGEVVDVIRGSIVERGTPSWTSGMVAAISASLGEAALQLLPNHDSLPNTGIAPPCHQRGKGRTGKRKFFRLIEELVFFL